MQLHPIAIALAVTAALAAFTANAQNVDTTPDWDPSASTSMARV
jgi:hypothetical protein